MNFHMHRLDNPMTETCQVFPPFSNEENRHSVKSNQTVQRWHLDYNPAFCVQLMPAPPSSQPLSGAGSLPTQHPHPHLHPLLFLGSFCQETLLLRPVPESLPPKLHSGAMAGGSLVSDSLSLCSEPPSTRGERKVGSSIPPWSHHRVL